MQNSKASIIGFFCGVILVIGANLYDDSNMDGSFCFDCFVSYGFPFRMWGTGGLVGITKIFWLGLIADILIGIIFSIGLGCVFQIVGKFIVRRQRRPTI
jgi:hypothetical protein